MLHQGSVRLDLQSDKLKSVVQRNGQSIHCIEMAEPSRYPSAVSCRMIGNPETDLETTKSKWGVLDENACII